MTILLIHGIGQQTHKSDPAALHALWRELLMRGVQQLADGRTSSELPTRMAFYADITNPNRPAARVQEAESERFKEELAQELRQKQTQAWYNNSIVTSSLRIVDHYPFLETTLGASLLSALAQEALVYLQNEGVRAEVHERVMSEIQEGQSVSVVVGHSLGSVIAYDLLASGALKCSGLITLGSPLGSRAFQRRLQRMPAHLHVWAMTDVRDPLDLVCFNATELSDLATNLSEITFARCEVDNSTDNKHGIAGYLATRAAATCLISMLHKEAHNEKDGPFRRVR